MMNWFKKSKKDDSEESAKKEEENDPDDAETKSDKEESDPEAKQSPEAKSDNDEESDPEAKPSSEAKSNDDKESEKDATSENAEEEAGEEPKSSSDKDEDAETSEEPKADANTAEGPGEDSENSDIIRLEGDGPEYAFDEVIDIAGYGWFQKQLTLLAGMGWFADAFEIIILSLLGDYLACSWDFHRWENSLLTSTVFIGMMCGAPFFGVIADNYGRRTALAISLLFLFLLGAGSALSGDFITLVVLRSMMGFSLGGIAQGITLCSEYYPAKNRGIAGFYLSYYWAIGTILLILVAWLIMDTTENGWNWLLFAASIPALIVFISIKWYPESVRFYLVNNQHEKAVKQLNVLLKQNKTQLEPGTLKRSAGQGPDEKKGNILDLLRSPHTVTTLLFWYIWFATAFHYYGLVLISPVIIVQGKVILTPSESAKAFHTNATSSSEFFKSKIPCIKYTKDNYIDLLWTSAAEVPGLLIFTILVQYIQRKTLLGLSSFTNTVIVLLMLVDFHSPIVTKILLFIARANICGLFQLVFIMTSETFPTTLRAVSMGSGSAYARLGGAVVPFATQGLIINDPIATICILSAVILLCGLAAALLPHEMKDVHMKDYSGQYKKKDEEESA